MSQTRGDTPSAAALASSRVGLRMREPAGWSTAARTSDEDATRPRASEGSSLRRGLATAREHGQQAVVSYTHAGRKGGRRGAIEPMQVQCHDKPQREKLECDVSIVNDRFLRCLNPGRQPRDFATVAAMRLVVLIALAACSGPTSPPIYGRHSIDSSYEDQGPRVQRPPTNAPPDPIGTQRPGERSCNDNHDCKPGEACVAPDFEPASSLACRADTGCPTNQVCEKSGCTAACTETSCPLGTLCRRDGHCAAVPCTEPSAPSCPMNSRCNRRSGNCDRMGCTSRAECDAGVCFQHRCYAHDAFCLPASSADGARSDAIR